MYEYHIDFSPVNTANGFFKKALNITGAKIFGIKKLALNYERSTEMKY